MPTTDTKILEAIKLAVRQAAGSLPIAWPGDDDFAPPVSGSDLLPYLAVGGVNTAVRAFISSDAPLDRTGILTVSYVARLGYDKAWYVERASALLASFPLDRGRKFQGVCVKWGNPPAVPRISAGYRDNGYFRTPVIIPWRCSAA